MAVGEEPVCVGFAPCFCCHRLFGFDVEKVPSFAGEPVCRPCMDVVNDRRAQKGLPPHPILPGAYPLDETDDDLRRGR